MDEKGFRIGESGREVVLVIRRSDSQKDGRAGGVKQSKLRKLAINKHLLTNVQVVIM